MTNRMYISSLNIYVHYSQDDNLFFRKYGICADTIFYRKTPGSRCRKQKQLRLRVMRNLKLACGFIS